jgi:hypothetical protein
VSISVVANPEELKVRRARESPSNTWPLGKDALESNQILMMPEPNLRTLEGNKAVHGSVCAKESISVIDLDNGEPALGAVRGRRDLLSGPLNGIHFRAF